MATTFNVLYLGGLSSIEGSELNSVAENAEVLVGETDVAPEVMQNADMAALEAKPIQSLHLDSVDYTSDQDMHVDLQEWNYAVCFTTGTMILTPEGEVPVERLKAGDLVVTRDHGAQPLLWAGCSRSDVQHDMQPVRIVAGALGNGLPRRDLLVSPQHRILIKAPTKGGGIEEVLIPAIKLTELDGIYVETSFEQITYCHILCQHHEVVFAFGAQTETLYFGDVAQAAFSERARNDLLRLFPGLDVTQVDPGSPLADGADGQRKVRELRAKRVKELQ